MLLGRRRIALFGLSANPPTGLLGHQGIVRILAHQGLFDEIWVLPVFQHIYSSKRELLIDFDHRVRMCELLFPAESIAGCTVRVLTLEKDVKEHYSQQMGPDYQVGTVDLLEYLHNVDCLGKVIGGDKASYHFVVALDTLYDLALGKWKNVPR
jgi:nicotinic acid mononucleotide adenylyltransferase